MKYFRYAIWEILLVVIGILIALSINKWNNNRNNITLETKYIQGIINDINEDLNRIRGETFREIISVVTRPFINFDHTNMRRTFEFKF